MTAPPRAAIISPSVDALCTGGLSLLVLVPLLVAGRTDLLLLSAGVQAWLGALVNMPHFLASYRMVYRTRASIAAHPWAAIYVPSILVSGCIAAVVASQWTDAPITTLLTISSSYLAWHYTGQAWGMTATFTYLAGASFHPIERRLVRGSLYILMAWHVVWFFHLGYHEYVDLTPVYDALSFLTAVALAMGLAGFSLHRARTSAFFNIHHYFTDGVVWKLRDPAVREDLFGHLAQPAPVQAVAPAPPPSPHRGGRGR